MKSLSHTILVEYLLFQAVYWLLDHAKYIFFCLICVNQSIQRGKKSTWKYAFEKLHGTEWKLYVNVCYTHIYKLIYCVAFQISVLLI